MRTAVRCAVHAVNPHGAAATLVLVLNVDRSVLPLDDVLIATPYRLQALPTRERSAVYATWLHNARWPADLLLQRS